MNKKTEEKRVFVILRNGEKIFLLKSGETVCLPSFEVLEGEHEWDKMIEGVRAIFPEFTISTTKFKFGGDLSASADGSKRTLVYVFVIGDAYGWCGRKTEFGFEADVADLDTLGLSYLDMNVIANLRRLQEERRLI